MQTDRLGEDENFASMASPSMTSPKRVSIAGKSMKIDSEDENERLQTEMNATKNTEEADKLLNKEYEQSDQ